MRLASADFSWPGLRTEFVLDLIGEPLLVIENAIHRTIPPLVRTRSRGDARLPRTIAVPIVRGRGRWNVEVVPVRRLNVVAGLPIGPRRDVGEALVVEEPGNVLPRGRRAGRRGRVAWNALDRAGPDGASAAGVAGRRCARCGGARDNCARRDRVDQHRRADDGGPLQRGLSAQRQRLRKRKPDREGRDDERGGAERGRPRQTERAAQIRVLARERGETWLYMSHLFGSNFSLQVGRQNLREPRSWWWDKDLDALRLVETD